MADQELRDDLAKLIVEALEIGSGKHETSVILEIFTSLDATFPDSAGRFPANLLRGGRPDPERVARALAAAAPAAEVLVNELVRVGGRFMDMVQEVYGRLARHAATISGTGAAEKFRFERGGIDEERLTISPAFIEQWRHLCEAVQQVELGRINVDALRWFLLWDSNAFYGGGYVKAVDFTQLPGWVLAMNQAGPAASDADQRAAERLITAAERLVRAWIARLEAPGDHTEEEEVAGEEDLISTWLQIDEERHGVLLNDEKQRALYRQCLRQDRDLLRKSGLVGMGVGGDAFAGAGVSAWRESQVIGLDADMSPVLRAAGDDDAGFRQATPTPIGQLAGFIAMWRLGLVLTASDQPVPARNLPSVPTERAEWLSRYRAACDRATRWLTDEVFPPASTAEVTALIEKIEEFLNLPLWRQRELLYEIWVLCATLDCCEQGEWNVDQITLTRDGDEWVLQVGRSHSPVAMLRHSKQQSMMLNVWREPARQAGGREFTPDMTVSTHDPYAIDLLVVEAKDRVKMPSGFVRGTAGAESAGERTGLAVARRYAEALRPRAVWVCNHCHFRQPVRAEINHGTAWTQIRLADEFRPGHVPDAFAESVRHALALPAGLIAEAAPARGLVLVLDVTGSMEPRLQGALETLDAASALEAYGQFRAVLYSDHGDDEPFLVRKVGPYDNLVDLLAAIDPLPAGHGHDADEALEDAVQRCRELVDDIGPQDLLILTDAAPHPATECPYGIDYATEIRSLIAADCRILIASDWWTDESTWDPFNSEIGFSFAPLEHLLAAFPIVLLHRAVGKSGGGHPSSSSCADPTCSMSRNPRCDDYTNGDTRPLYDPRFSA